MIVRIRSRRIPGVAGTIAYTKASNGLVIGAGRGGDVPTDPRKDRKSQTREGFLRALPNIQANTGSAYKLKHFPYSLMPRFPIRAIRFPKRVHFLTRRGFGLPNARITFSPMRAAKTT
jgi:hypothetical protein